jgi:hypothetical protein
MALISDGNWSHRDPGDAIEAGSTISGGNFSQVVPDTPILVGKPLVITGGNWSNVRRDPAWTVNGGNWTQISLCSHLHPGKVAKGLLPSGHPANCTHVVDTDEVRVDGVLVDTIYHYADTVL